MNRRIPSPAAAADLSKFRAQDATNRRNLGNLRREPCADPDRAAGAGAAAIARELVSFGKLQKSLLAAAIHLIWNNIQMNGHLAGSESEKWREDVYVQSKEQLGNAGQEQIRQKLAVPTTTAVQVCDFVLSFLQNGGFSVPQFLLALMYLGAFKRSTGVMLHALTWRPLMVILLILTDKFWEDKPAKMGEMVSLYPALNVKELGGLEDRVYWLLKDNMIVSPEEFALFCLTLTKSDVSPDILRSVHQHEYVQRLDEDEREKGQLHHDQMTVPVGDSNPDPAWKVLLECGNGARPQSPTAPPQSPTALQSPTAPPQSPTAPIPKNVSEPIPKSVPAAKPNASVGSASAPRANSTGAIGGPQRPLQTDWSQRKTLPAAGQQKTSLAIGSVRGTERGGPLQQRRHVSSSNLPSALRGVGGSQYAAPPPMAGAGAGSPAVGGLSSGAREYSTASSPGVRNLATSGQVRGPGSTAREPLGVGRPHLASREPMAAGTGSATREPHSVGRPHLATREPSAPGAAGLAHSSSGIKRPDAGGTLAHSSSRADAPREGPGSLSGRSGTEPSTGRPSQFSPRRDNNGRLQVHSPPNRYNTASGMPPPSTGAQLHQHADVSQSRSPEPPGPPVSPPRTSMQATPRHVSNGPSGASTANASPASLANSGPASGTPASLTAGTPGADSSSLSQAASARMHGTQTQAPPPRTNTAWAEPAQPWGSAGDQARGRAVEAQAARQPGSQVSSAGATPPGGPPSGHREAQSAPAEPGRVQRRPGIPDVQTSALQQQRPAAQPAQASVAPPGVRASSAAGSAASQAGVHGSLGQRGAGVGGLASSQLGASTLSAGGARNATTAMGASAHATMPFQGVGGLQFPRGGYAPQMMQQRGNAGGAPPPPTAHQQQFMFAGRERSSSPAYQVGSGSCPSTARTVRHTGTPPTAVHSFR